MERWGYMSLDHGSHVSGESNERFALHFAVFCTTDDCETCFSILPPGAASLLKHSRLSPNGQKWVDTSCGGVVAVTPEDHLCCNENSSDEVSIADTS